MDTPTENNTKLKRIIILVFVIGSVGLLYSAIFLKDLPEEMLEKQSIFETFLGKRSDTAIEPAFPEIKSNRVPVEEVSALIKGNDDSMIAQMADLTGGNSAGTAYLLQDEGITYLMVDASLPQLSENEYYEVWLVNGLTAGITSAGMLEMQSNGGYALGYKAEASLDGYDQVVVTAETTEDKLMEKQLLLGTLVSVENEEEITQE